MAPYRRFRHVVMHSYSVQLDWERMQEGVEALPELFIEIQDELSSYLRVLETIDTP